MCYSLTMTAQPKQKMTVAEFIPWAMAQQKGRYELVGGEVVAQASERARHNLTKAAVYKALDAAIKKAMLPCTVFTDGMTVKIDDYTAREPDASVQCGGKVDPEMVVLDAPLIVVEAISPSSEKDDSSTKLAEYFSVPSIRHYLIVDAGKRLIIHHARAAGSDIATRIHKSGEIILDPPGAVLSVADILADT
jgi:Uma2 family endonuclease